MGNDSLVRTTILCPSDLANAARKVGAGNTTKGVNTLMRAGLDAMAGRPELELSPAELAELLAHRLREEARQPASITTAPSGALMVSEPTAEKIHQRRSETHSALLTMRTGLLLFGLGPDGEEACFAIDAEAGVAGITTRRASEQRELGDLCPAVHALAQLAAGVLGRTASAAAAGDGPESAPAGQHPRLGITIWGAHPADGLARIAIGEASVRIHSLQLTALASELFAMEARVVADAIAQRDSLEKTLSRTPSRRETQIAWSRSHGD